MQNVDSCPRALQHLVRWHLHAVCSIAPTRELPKHTSAIDSSCARKSSHEHALLAARQPGNHSGGELHAYCIALRAITMAIGSGLQLPCVVLLPWERMTRAVASTYAPLL